MTKIDLQTIGFTDSTSTLINANSSEIETKSDTFLSRDGGTPNEMLTDLDMNSNDILNLPAPTSQTSPVRLQDLTSLAVGPATTATITHNPNVMGSTSQNLQVKLKNEVLSVKDFGAVGNGVVDDATAINTALSSALANNVGTVILPGGTYRVATSIKMQAGVRLLGLGLATITQSTSQNLGQLIDFANNSANGAVLENCIIDGNRTNNAENDNVILVYVGQANDVVIKNNTIRNSPGYCLDVGTGARASILNNSVQNFRQIGIAQITNVPNTSGCIRIEGNRVLAPIGQHAIAVVNSDYATVRGNLVLAAKTLGVASAPLNVSTSGTTVTWVSGPNFSTVSAGQFLVINSGLEFFITSVTDSTHLQLSSSPGVLVNTPAAIGAGDLIICDSSSWGVYSDNTVFGGVTQGIGVSTTTGGQSAQKNLVSNNNISFSGEMGIGVAGVSGFAVTDTSVVGNIINNAGQSKLANGGAPLVNSGIGMFNSGPGTSNTFVDSNYIRDDQGAPTTLYWMALTGLSAGDVIIGKNGFKGTTNNGISGDIISIVLGAGWGTTAGTTSVSSNGDSVQFTITSSGIGQAATPQVTVNKVVRITGEPPVLISKMVAGSGALQHLFGEQNSSGGAWFTFYNGTPVAGNTFVINLKG